MRSAIALLAVACTGSPKDSAEAEDTDVGPTSGVLRVLTYNVAGLPDGISSADGAGQIAAETGFHDQQHGRHDDAPHEPSPRQSIAYGGGASLDRRRKTRSKAPEPPCYASHTTWRPSMDWKHALR